MRKIGHTPAVVAIAILVYLAAAATSPSVSAKEIYHLNLDPEGIAVKGFDLVSYFTPGDPERGHPDFMHQHEGAKYLFASSENRDRFVENPVKYLPAYGGFCSYGVVLGKKYDISPDAWRIVNGTLFFEHDKGTRMIWDGNRDKFIEIGQRTWPSIKHIPAHDL